MRKIAIMLLCLWQLSNLAAIDLDLTTAKKLALKNNPSLLAEKEKYLASKSEKWNSLSNLLPSLQATAGHNRFYPEQTMGFQTAAEHSYSYGFTVNQPLFQGGKLWLSSRIKNDAEKIAEANYFAKKLETIAAVEEKYFSVLKNQKLLEIARLDLKNSNTNLAIAATKYKAGIISKSDYLQLKAEKSTKEVNLLQMQNLFETQMLDLANFLQVEELNKVQFIKNDEYEKLLSTLQAFELKTIKAKSKEIVEIGLSQNPTIKPLKLAVETGKKSVLMAGGNFLPSVNLSFSQNYTKYNYMDDYEESGTLALSASLPLFPILDNTSTLASAKHSLKKSEYTLINTKQSIKLALQNSFYTLVANAKSLTSAQLALEQAEETYQRMQNRFKSGLISANELISIQTMLLSTKNEYYTTFFDFLQSKSTLLQQMGLEKEEKLLSIINK